ncbi:Imm1 family immunity protein [Kribbella sp. NPDC051770]|uniref:Imm1 family immunity protein n=1 Tax=Kribbella sp. NPDC051770 TaxID=3155413 RepID=UPI003444A9BB
MEYTASAYYKHGHDENPVKVSTVDELRALIDAVLSEPIENSVVALYINERPLAHYGAPDHELRLAVDASRKLGSIRYTTIDQTLYAVGIAAGKTPVRYQYMGHAEEFPADSAVELDVLLAVAADFLAGGANRTPEGVEWNDWPDDL